MAKAKTTAKTIKNKSLYDLVVLKSKKFVEKLKAPIQKANLQRQFQTQVSNAATDFIEAKAEIITLLMDVRNVDVQSIINFKKLMKEIYEEMLIVTEVYENLFGKQLKLDVKEEDLVISAADVLSMATTIDDVEDDE